MNYVWMALCGLLGLFAYSMWKCMRINSKYENETIDSVVKVFLKKERFTLLMNVSAIAILMVFTGMAWHMRADGIPLPWGPKWLNDFWPYFINGVFILIGIAGGWLLISGLNLTEKYFQKKEKDVEARINS
jgi:hypothetical protein